MYFTMHPESSQFTAKNVCLIMIFTPRECFKKYCPWGNICETRRFPDQKLSSSIFPCCCPSVRPTSVASPLISTIWYFRPYKPFLTYFFWRISGIPPLTDKIEFWLVLQFISSNASSTDLVRMNILWAGMWALWSVLHWSLPRCVSPTKVICGSNQSKWTS